MKNLLVLLALKFNTNRLKVNRRFFSFICYIYRCDINKSTFEAETIPYTSYLPQSANCYFLLSSDPDNDVNVERAWSILMFRGLLRTHNLEYILYHTYNSAADRGH